MSIYTFLADDDGSTLLGGLNANFAELDADKIEATQTVALTNKTIDGDLNTIKDLAVSTLKSDAKTGLDTKVVTGTKGTSGNLSKWNVDGDLVDAEVATETTLTDSDSKISTSKAVKTYVDSKLGGNKSLFVHYASTNGAASNVSYYQVASLNSGQEVYYKFQVPLDYVSGATLKIAMIPDATETIQWDIYAVQANNGETYSTTASDLNVTTSVTVDLMTYVNVGTSTNMSVLLTSLSAGDVVGILFNSNTTLLRTVGLIFEYA